MLVQILPNIGSAPGGVRDYALLLAEELKRSHGIEIVFIAGETDGTIAHSDIASWTIRRIFAWTSQCLQKTVEQVIAGDTNPVLLLHYVNYGYQKRGVPFCLNSGLKRLKSSFPDLKLITVFHELYATGNPWQSSFWLSPSQRSLAKQVAHLSDWIITSIPLYQRELLGWGISSDRISLHQVFSTAGELYDPTPLNVRRRQMVVFGTPGLKKRLYEKMGIKLHRVMSALKLDEIVDIGAPSFTNNNIFQNISIIQTGIIPVQKISEILAESYAGALFYAPAYLGKSTVFATYCAYGLLPIVFSSEKAEDDGITVGKHYLRENFAAQPYDDDMFQIIATASHARYFSHGLENASRLIARIIRQLCNGVGSPRAAIH